MTTLQVTLAPDQLEALADMIVGRMQQAAPLTFEQAATRLGISVRTLTRLTEDGTLQRLPGTHRRLISPTELDRYLTNS